MLCWCLLHGVGPPLVVDKGREVGGIMTGIEKRDASASALLWCWTLFGFPGYENTTAVYTQKNPHSIMYGGVRLVNGFLTRESSVARDPVCSNRKKKVLTYIFLLWESAKYVDMRLDFFGGQTFCRADVSAKIRTLEWDLQCFS